MFTEMQAVSIPWCLTVCTLRYCLLEEDGLDVCGRITRVQTCNKDVTSWLESCKKGDLGPQCAHLITGGWQPQSHDKGVARICLGLEWSRYTEALDRRVVSALLHGTVSACFMWCNRYQMSIHLHILLRQVGAWTSRTQLPSASSSRRESSGLMLLRVLTRCESVDQSRVVARTPHHGPRFSNRLSARHEWNSPLAPHSHLSKRRAAQWCGHALPGACAL